MPRDAVSCVPKDLMYFWWPGPTSGKYYSNTSADPVLCNNYELTMVLLHHLPNSVPIGFHVSRPEITPGTRRFHPRAKKQ